jgi:hypothetical protein
MYGRQQDLQQHLLVYPLVTPHLLRVPLLLLPCWLLVAVHLMLPRLQVLLPLL